MSNLSESRSDPASAFANAVGYHVTASGAPEKSRTRKGPAEPRTSFPSGSQRASTRIGTGEDTNSAQRSAAAWKAGRTSSGKPEYVITSVAVVVAPACPGTEPGPVAGCPGR